MTTYATAMIYKDGVKPSRPWAADLHFPDGTVWKKWQSGYRSMTTMMPAIVAIGPRVNIERRRDMDNGS